MLAFLVVWPAIFFLMAHHMGVKLADLTGKEFLAQYGFVGVLKLYGIPTVMSLVIALFLKAIIGDRQH